MKQNGEPTNKPPHTDQLIFYKEAKNIQWENNALTSINDVEKTAIAKEWVETINLQPTQKSNLIKE